MVKKTLSKYAKFIADNDFLKEFMPGVDLAETDSEPAEAYIFTYSPRYVRVVLRDYQIEGLNWLIKMHENGINCILADEMGLGKTLQTIAFLGYLKFVKDEKSKHLIVVPKSCLQNWHNEFKRFIPEMKVKIFHVSKSEIKKESKTLSDRSYDIVLTTYEMCLFAKNYFKDVSWSYIVIDEAHRLKNENSQLSKIVRIFKFKHRLLLTGTPLQNNIHELWALLNYIVPEFFSNSEKFESYVLNADKEAKSIEKLRNVLQLFFLRREKIDVEKSLMAKKYVNIYCPLSDMQREWYKSILKRDLSGVYLDKGIKTTLLNIVMQLKKCCNHPYLFEGAEPEPFEAGEHLVQNSGKMLIVDKLLARLKQKGSRVLIFSQMSQMLDILEDYAVFRGFTYCRIDGKTATEERTRAIDSFNAPDSDKFMFLLTTRAGGLGINLYTADTVILFDSDWNPQADLQAQDRAHRIGQKKQVHVFRFITDSTIEEGIYLRAQQKLKLDDILIQKEKRVSHTITEGELVDILSHGIDLNQNVSTEMSLEEILKRGEDKTREVEDKMLGFKIADTLDSKIDLYQWEGENYSRKRLEEYISANADDSRPKRISLFSSKKFKRLVFPEYQFYPREFYELQNTEEELFSKGEELPEADKEAKEELLKQGFDWTKKDFKTFLSAVEQYYDDIAKIKAALPNKTDVEKYYTVFFERYNEIPDIYKVPSLLEKARLRNDRKHKLREIFCCPSERLERYLQCKNRLYVDNLHLLMLYNTHMDDPHCFEKIRSDIILDSDLSFDYYLATRSASELAKHINTMLSQLLKMFETK